MKTVKSYSDVTHKRYSHARGPSRFVKEADIPAELLARFKAHQKAYRKLMKTYPSRAHTLRKEHNLQNFEILCPGENFYDKKFLLETHGNRQYFFRKLRDDLFILMRGASGTIDCYAYTDETFDRFKNEIASNEDFLKRTPQWEAIAF